MKRLFALMLALVICNASWAFVRETISVESKAMNKQERAAEMARLEKAMKEAAKMIA